MSSPLTYDEINLEAIAPLDFFTDEEIQVIFRWKTMLSEMKSFIDRANLICQGPNIPKSLKENLEVEKEEFLERYSKLLSGLRVIPNSEDTTSIINAGTTNIKIYHTSFFEMSSSNQHLLLLNTIDSYENDHIEAYSEKFASFSNRFTLLSNELKDKIDVASILNQELREKASQAVVSNYANIFLNQEDVNRKSAINWLWISCILSSLIIIFLFLSISGDWFHITSIRTIKEGNNIITQEVYNYPNLITKIFIISVSLYLISFSFKQYSINKHLQTLNNHRKNALNSYELFTNTIGKDDTSSKNALMLQVAKSIYENSNTGFLSAKQSDAGTNALTEITKFVTESKQS